jgi:hypothetical protein
VRVWEHESPEEAADRIEELVRSRNHEILASQKAKPRAHVTPHGRKTKRSSALDRQTGT